MNQHSTRRAVALFSGGLDSILAARLIQEQGIEVIGLHFMSPFFGKPEKLSYWEKEYGLPLRGVDISEDFAALLARRPEHGFGSVMNPCVDCKILMLTKAREMMLELGAGCIISGEVLGQRPMSQRRDTLNVIRREAGVRELLLRPLSALRLEPSRPELEGFVDRERLLGISGRGRKDQLALAARFGIRDIPTPAGGCRLAERENARAYWPVLRHSPSPRAADFELANTGRQYWHVDEQESGTAFWLCVGRNQADNEALMALCAENDLLFKTRDFPGPVALGRFLGRSWPDEAQRGAAAFMSSYSGKARHAAGRTVAVRVHPGSLDNPGRVLEVEPAREPEFSWREFTFEEVHADLRAEAR